MTYAVQYEKNRFETWRGYYYTSEGFELPDKYTVSSIAQQILNEFDQGPYVIELQIIEEEPVKRLVDVIDRWHVATGVVIDRDDAMVLAAKIMEAIERFEENDE